MENKVEASINQVNTECSKLAKKKCKRRYNTQRMIPYRKLVKEFNFEVKDRWYQRESEKVLKEEDCKILSDFGVQADHVIIKSR